MAKITLNDLAKSFEGKIHFSFGSSEFDLGEGDTFETNDPSVISAANSHSFLNVEASEDATYSEWAKKEVERLNTSTDPNENPRADHLSAVADEAAIEKAEKKAEHIRDAKPGQLVIEALQASQPAPEETTSTPSPAASEPAPAPADSVPAAPDTPTTQGQTA